MRKCFEFAKGMDDCDDEGLLEAVMISEANAMLEDTKTAAAESTSGN